MYNTSVQTSSTDFLLSNNNSTNMSKSVIDPGGECQKMGTSSILAKSKAVFQNRIDDHEIERQINPFSEYWEGNKGEYHDKLQGFKGVKNRNKLTKADDNYAFPTEGSLTEKRAHKARDFIAKNIVECCDVIRSLGVEQSDGTHTITFGKLFKAYERINDKLVGCLLRARKHGYVEFPGEMLYQCQDEPVIIRLLKVPTFQELTLHFIEFEKPKNNNITINIENGIDCNANQTPDM